MKTFLTEDEITEIFSSYLIKSNWSIVRRATGYKKGVDIVADLNGKILCIEAKGGGSQSERTKRFGHAFSYNQCNIHVDRAFTSLARMKSRYNPDYVGLILPKDENHRKSVSEILHGINFLGAGAWLVGIDSIEVLCEPKLIK